MSSFAKGTDDIGAPAELVALCNMMDYAIIEGAQLKMPTFVFLLRLARMALVEASAYTASHDTAQRSLLRGKPCPFRKERRSKNDEARSRAANSGPSGNGKDAAAISGSIIGPRDMPHLYDEEAVASHGLPTGADQ